MMEQKIYSTIEKNSMFSRGDMVVVALSGGADSVALFDFLHSHRDTLGISICAAHFDHGLRGEESKRDARFVEQLCEKYNVVLYKENAEMGSKEKPGKTTVESWARNLRYDFFERVAAQVKGKVATAHTVNDNAETILFRLARGTGPRGLAGIPAVRGIFCRPLLDITRKEVEQYCAANQLSFVVDSTNQQPIYARNRIRSQLLPLLEDVHPGAAQAMARMAYDMGQLSEYLTKQAQQVLCAAEMQGGYDKNILLGTPQPVLLQLLSILVGASASRQTLEKMVQVLKGEQTSFELPKNRLAVCSENCFKIQAAEQKREKPSYAIPLRQGEFHLPHGYFLKAKVVEKEKEPSLYQQYLKKGLTFAADYDKIIGCGFIRARKQGDTYALPKRGLSKTIKKWMNEQKIPVQQRDFLPLLAVGNTVYWVFGFGFCDTVWPEQSTNRLLILEGEARKE